MALPASIVRPVLSSADACSASERLDSGWEYYRGALDSPWEVWRGDEIAAWEKVSLPHCFNHYDACDPDTPYYRGHGWYRTRLPIANPIDRTGARCFISKAPAKRLMCMLATRWPARTSGVTTNLSSILPTQVSDRCADAAKSGIPIAVLCDNSENLERSPSDLSDFSLYGGLYRHVHLAYVPPFHLRQFTSRPLRPGSPATVKVKARLYNPAKFSGRRQGSG